jgi:hypothetical protein
VIVSFAVNPRADSSVASVPAALSPPMISRNPRRVVVERAMMVLLVCVEIDPPAVYRRGPPQTTGEDVRDWGAYPITTRQAYERAKSSDDYWDGCAGFLLFERGS